MKKIYILAIILLTSGLATAQTTLVNYDYNSATSYPISPSSNASGITGSFTSSEGFITYGGSATDGSAFTQNTTAGNAIAMSNSSGTNTRYFLLELSGANLSQYQSLQLYVQSQKSSTGANTINIATSTDGINYTNQSTTITTPTTFASSVVSLTGLTGASTIYIKLMASGASGTGTLRLDNLEIQGTLVPTTTWQNNGSNIYYTAGNVGVGNNNPAYPLDVTGAVRISGATTVNNITSTGNAIVGGSLGVTGTSNFTGLVTTGALTSGATTLNSLSISSLTGTGNRQLLVSPTGGVLPGPLSFGNQWSQGGDNNVTSTSNLLGPINPNTDLILITGGTGTTGAATERMRISANGRIGIGGFTSPNVPKALMHINTLNSGTTPGLIVDNGSPFPTNVPEFIVNSDGSAAINNYISLPSIPNDMFSINFQSNFAGLQNYDIIKNVLRVAYNVDGSGHVGIAGTFGNYIAGATPVVASTYKTLTVNGDVSLANFSSTNGTPVDGKNGIEILGADRVPNRRGISTDNDNDGTGNFNFYINSNQSAAQFNFKNGTNSSNVNYSNGTSTPNLMTINANGELILSKLPTLTPSGSNFMSVLVDATTGKLVHGGVVASANSVEWALGGNASAGATLGTTDLNSDLPIIAGNKEVVRVSATGNLVLNNDPDAGTSPLPSSQLLLKTYLNGPDTHHGLGYFLNYNNGAGVSKTINGPVLYGYQGGALATTNGSTKFALKWDDAGKIYIGSQTLSGTHADAILQVFGKAVSTSFYVTIDNWADYVFKDNYKAMPINELKAYVEKNHHLPEVPSEEELKTNGLNVGEMDKVLMKKIEELTLYIIELKGEVNSLKEKTNK